MFGWLFGKKAPPAPVPHHKGDGYHELDVVGESYRAAVLRKLMAGVAVETSGWARLETVAHLMPVSNNGADPNAVEVRIDGKHVGYLDRGAAKVYRKTIGNSPISIDALILGKEGKFGVKLDLE